MKPYIISLAAGLLVGIVYGLLEVRSPAPPVIALVGLLGILAGEQIVPIVKRLVAHEPISIGWIQKECAPHILGELPAGESLKASTDSQGDTRRSG